MTFVQVVRCLLLHWRKHRVYGDRSRKCFRCGTYYRRGPASPRFNKRRDN